MKNKLGIVVPYRDRHRHLEKFRPHITEYLEDQGFEFTVIVVEQDNASAFNRGMLCNIGFQEAKEQGCNYVVFHDVDMLPVEVDYSYSKHPVHLATYDIPFPAYFGGITLFPIEDFEKINGFSNIYWGWGFEDDDLRYRCVKVGIDFSTHSIQDSITTAIFNGVSAYAKIPNVINYNRDFSIILDLHLDRFYYDPDKQVDKFPILSIKGCDLELSYTSFNRFYLQAFNRKEEYFDLFSDLITSSKNTVKIEYIRAVNRIKFTVNSKKVGYINLTTQLYNYSNADFILLGTDNTIENFYRGTIDSLHIEQQGALISSYVPVSLQNYQLNDLTSNENHGDLVDVYIDEFTSPIDYYSYIPHRRKSLLKLLPHRGNGFLNGQWKSETTRWNQLRYNNEVQNGDRDNIEDGLSTLKFTLHGKTQEGTYTHLNVGI